MGIMHRAARVIVVTFALLTLISPTAAAQEPPGPFRPLPEPSVRPLPAGGDLVFVDAARGDDAGGHGSRQRPLRTLQRAFQAARPGQTICLRGGVHYGHATLRARGVAGRPITVRSAPGELAVLDGGIPDFVADPARAWEPCPGGSPGEYRSTKALPGLHGGAGGDADGEGHAHVFGHFADTMVPLQAYRFRGDLVSDNPYWNVSDKAGGQQSVYCGPGLWYDAASGRLHCRLAPTKLPGLGTDNYRGPSDPRAVRLTVAGRRDLVPLTLDGTAHVRLQDLVLRGAAGAPLVIDRCREIELDGLTVYGGAGCVSATATHGLRVAHTALRGIAAPWTFRGSLKYRSVESRLFSSGAWGPSGDDGTAFEFAYCEFTDSVDGVFVGNVRGVRIRNCLLDNVSDDGFFVTANTGYDGHTPGGDVHLHHNLISRCLTSIAFGVGHGRQRMTAGGRQTGAGLHIYRNVFDFRRPVNYYWPTGPDAPQEIETRGRFAGDHGSPTWEPMRIYHNTLLAGDAHHYDYLATGLGGAVVPGTTRRVFNNVVLQSAVAPGGTLPPAEADFAADGNLYWTADPGARASGDPLETFRKSPVAVASKRRYAPGWCAADRWADPQLTAYSTDWRQTVDLRLAAGSPAIDSGVDVPADWPDPLRRHDDGRPDRGALPAGTAPWRVGVGGRLTVSGAPAPGGGPAPEVRREFLPATRSDAPGPPAIARAAIFTGYPAFDAPMLAYLLRRQGTAVDLFDRTFPETGGLASYALVAIDGSMARAELAKTRFDAVDVPRLREFLERGGSLLLMRERADVFGTEAGRAFLAELTGPDRRLEPGGPRVAEPQHPWVSHLTAAGGPDAWLSKLAPSPLVVSRGTAPLEAGAAQAEARAAVLCRLPLGAGQLIYVGWSPAAAMPHGRLESTVALEESFEAQVEVLRRVLADPRGAGGVP